jgi:hypothetical protein
MRCVVVQCGREITVIPRMFQPAVLSAPSAPQPFTPQQYICTVCTTTLHTTAVYLHRLHHNPSHHSSSLCTVCTTTLHTTAVLSVPSAPQPFTPQQNATSYWYQSALQVWRYNCLWQIAENRGNCCWLVEVEHNMVEIFSVSLRTGAC